jgi:hypothetical protein
VPDGKWTKPAKKERVLDILQNRASKHEPEFRLKRDEGRWSAPKPLSDIIGRLRKVLPKVDVGTRYRIKSSDGAVWEIRKVEISLVVVADTIGTPAIDKIYGTVVNRFRGVENWGIYSCRRIAGSSRWSQHAFKNAWDIHHGTLMGEIADFLVKNYDILDVAEVIYNRRIWTRSEGWRTYSGSNPHTDHIHVSGFPLATGVPPCAR